MSKKREQQKLIRAYKDETGKREIDMKEVAKWAVGKGWPLPIPRNPLDVLAQSFAEAAREEQGAIRKLAAFIAQTILSRPRRVASNSTCGLISTKPSAAHS